METSYNTTLSVVNFSGRKIKETKVTDWIEHDWDYKEPDRKDPYRPDLNFTGPLDDFDARCEREEINAAATEGAHVTLTFYFDDQAGNWVRFRVNQRDSFDKSAGLYPAEMSAGIQDLEVYRETGETRYDGGNVYSNTFYIRKKSKPDNSGWMHALMNSKPGITINEITIPGSHNAGMYVDSGSSTAGGGEQSLTQSLTIRGQLEAGARYFDIRIWEHSRGEFWTYHGTAASGTYGAKLDVILQDVINFLNDPRSSKEVVFLKFRDRDDADNGERQRTADFVKSKLGDKLFKQSSKLGFAVEKLEKFAGKVVAVFDRPYINQWSPGAGIFQYSDQGTPGADGFVVYDVFSETSSFSTMAEDQSKKLAAFGGYGKLYLFLLSWTKTGKVADILDLELLARYTNPQLVKKLRSISVPPNIVYIDYVEPYICSAIIELNRRWTIFQDYIHASQVSGGMIRCAYFAERRTHNGAWMPTSDRFCGLTVQEPGTVPIYQFHATNPDRYLYTTDKASGASFGQFEGIAFYAFEKEEQGTVPFYRSYQDQGQIRNYAHTIDRMNGWVDDGIAFYAHRT